MPVHPTLMVKYENDFQMTPANSTSCTNSNRSDCCITTVIRYKHTKERSSSWVRAINTFSPDILISQGEDHVELSSNI